MPTSNTYSEEQLQTLANQLRADSLRTSTKAGSGHPTSAMSAADVMSVLMTGYLKYNFGDPGEPHNDHLIFSKGHASGLLYGMYRAAGAITDDEMMTYRQRGSRMQGHPTPALPWVDVATGSLGQGLPIGVGVAIAGKYLDKLDYRVWVLCGDSEFAEGSIYEALDKAGHYELDNLTAILDMNRLGQRGQTAHGWDSTRYAARAQAFGWHTIEIDGHNFAEIDAALGEAATHTGQPTLIIARTMKGAGVSFMADKDGFHGKALDATQLEAALEELGGQTNVEVSVQHPEPAGSPERTNGDVTLPTYAMGEKVATRQAYGDALKALGDARNDVVVVDAEVSNSTMAEVFKKAYPERFFEMFIAEQQMVAAAVGLSVRGYVPFASTFGAFMSRAYDFARMAAISQANIRLCGSHAGVSIGEDGPSQMALEDIASMRAIHGSTVLYPSDPNQTAHLVALLADNPGVSYLRTTREKTPVIYDTDATFRIGGSAMPRQSFRDQVTVVAAGITLHEALKAADTLAEDNVHIRVVDAYSVKPLDVLGISSAVQGTAGRVVVVEDHWPEGGIASAMLEGFATQTGDTPGTSMNMKLIHLAPRDLPGSASPAEQLDAAGISAKHIIEAVKSLIG